MTRISAKTLLLQFAHAADAEGRDTPLRALQDRADWQHIETPKGRDTQVRALAKPELSAAAHRAFKCALWSATRQAAGEPSTTVAFEVNVPVSRGGWRP